MKREILINDMEKDYEGYCPGTEIPNPVGGSDVSQSIIFLPLVAQDRAIGNISVQSYKKNAYTQYHLGMMRNIAIYTSIALENSRAYEELADEKEKSDKLLLNILPKQTAEELKQNGFAAPQSYEEATVIFSDFKGFTQIAEKLTPFELVHELNRCFLAFDEICEKHGIERIKTIGDAYMAVCGVPDPSPATAYRSVCAALEMQAVVMELNKPKIENGEPVWNIRIGINTGPVVAGVIGKKKFAYDVWGETVNLAARMEQSGEPGKVNISHFTYLKIKDSFSCDHRGKVSAKNIGEVDMYFVEKI